MGEGVLWKTRNFRNLNQKPLADGKGRAYIASSRRPLGLDRGPRNGPEAKLVGSFLKVFGLLRVAEKSSKKAVDGKEDWVLYPAPHRRRAGRQGRDGGGQKQAERPRSAGCLTL